MCVDTRGREQHEGARLAGLTRQRCKSRVWFPLVPKSLRARTQVGNVGNWLHRPCRRTHRVTGGSTPCRGSSGGARACRTPAPADSDLFASNTLGAKPQSTVQGDSSPQRGPSHTECVMRCVSRQKSMSVTLHGNTQRVGLAPVLR